MNEASIELLDDFAAAALVGLLSGELHKNGERWVALTSYSVALEMIKAREEAIKSMKEQA